jgi:hypothetical protein
MNVHVTALQEQHDSWKAARERLFGTKKVEISTKPIIRLVEALPPPPPAEPEWMSKEVHFDDHVLAWRSLIAKLLREYIISMPMDKRSAKEIIMEVLEMFPGVNFREVQGPARNRKVVRARQVAMFEVAKQRPDLSTPVIGSIFGDRDHTTVIHAIQKIRAMKEAGDSLYLKSENF